MHRTPSRLLRSSARLAPSATAAAASPAAAAFARPLLALPLTRTVHSSPARPMLIEQTTLSSASAAPPQEPTVNEEKARQIARDFRT